MASDLNLFIDILKNDLQTLSELETLLFQERDNLEKNQINALDDLTSRKNPLLARLEDHANAKSCWVRECKLPLPRLLELLAAKAPVAMNLYQQCQNKLKDIHRLNEVNGRIIAASHQRVEKLMCIIRGQSKQIHIYGENGTRRAISSNHYLAQA
jgi:flagellar biosynthesis protein FlgN